MKRILMFTSACALLITTSCKSHSEKKEEEIKFLVTSPILMDTATTQEYVSQIHSIQHIEIRAQERGYLDKIYVDEGQFVKQGDLLFQIMPRLYQAEQKKAKAEAEFAEIEYLNTKKLADSNVVAPNELAMAKAKYDKAMAELALADVHLQFTEIRAPFDGYIDRFHVRLGSLVDEGDLLTSLSDNSEMWVYFNVPEAEYLEYKTQLKTEEKMKVKLMMANNKPFKYGGVVQTIEADFNNETGNIAFRATFPNPDGLLRHGETGNVIMTVPLKGAMLIPQKATFEVLDKRYVYVLDKENVLHSREIVVGAEMEHIYAVQRGLEEGDRILLEGLRLVRENEEVDPEFVEPKVALADLELYAE
ncbi:efflux RND transporter periplasmic adaptor subunit [Owenweeksia hongkongensis]|uniref:efflux RND transporter periplasmic adaptor subunit n=1 Tax=Owenweeksia hongkongensis TaxID=253245 RepID=UPI003A8FECA9